MPSRPIDTAGRPFRLPLGLAALLGLCLLVGCESWRVSEVSYIGEADLHYYQDRATNIAAPEMTTRASEQVATLPPHTISDRSHDEVRDIKLAEAITLSLSNSKIIRRRGTFLSPNSSLLISPQLVNSIYDPAIQAASTTFGNRGVEAALADFDTLVTTQMMWGRNEQIQNSLFNFGLEPGQTLQQDTAQFSTRLEKPFATGSVFSLSHNVNYGYNNASNRLFPSAYTGNIQAEFRQPLLQGAGIQFNRIAGPQSRTRNSGRGAQFTNGVLIARIKSDIAIAQFQRASRNLVREVEEAYWNLALAYHVYHARVVAEESTLATWQRVQVRHEKGLEGGGSADLAQAQDSYLQRRASAEAARAGLYSSELILRRITGLPVNDGTILRPVSDPITSRFRPDWYSSLCEALTSRTELRRQKWQIKSLELQLAAAENFAQPSLDFVSRYRVNGFGDKLLANGDNDVANTAQGLNNFYGNILQGNQTGWNLGVELSMPVGLRAAKSQVQWYELRLAKSRAALGTMEHEISLQLAAAFQDVSQYYKIAQTNLNRRAAAEERVRAYETKYKLGGTGQSGGSQTSFVDLLLRSQISLAEAEVAYWQAIFSYNQAIADVYLRQGTLLERNGISLAEGSWEPGAYEQALHKAWARSHAIDNPLLEAVPKPFANPGETMPTLIPRLVPDSGTIPGGPTPVPPAPAPEAETLPPLLPAPRLEPPPALIPEIETPAEPQDDFPAVIRSPDSAPGRVSLKLVGSSEPPETTISGATKTAGWQSTPESSDWKPSWAPADWEPTRVPTGWRPTTANQPDIPGSSVKAAPKVDQEPGRWQATGQ